eukprot:gene25996-biopygen12734
MSSSQTGHCYGGIDEPKAMSVSQVQLVRIQIWFDIWSISDPIFSSYEFGVPNIREGAEGSDGGGGGVWVAKPPKLAHPARHHRRRISSIQSIKRLKIRSCIEL